MNLNPIKFKDVDHLIAEIKRHLDPKFKHSTRRIAAALLSLWKWEQNEKCRYGDYRLKCGPKTCGLCHIGDEYCNGCYLNIYNDGCMDLLIEFEDFNNKQPLIGALQKAVLHEFASVFVDECVEVVREAVKL